MPGQEKKSLLTKKDNLISKLNRFELFIANYDVSRDKNQLPRRLENLLPILNDFEEIIQDLQSNSLITNEGAQAELNEFESRYYEVEAQFQALSQPTAQANTNGCPTQPNILKSVKLPPIELPSFNGDPCSFICFKDNFVSLIHNDKNYPNTMKFHYLKSCLKGPALDLIDNLPLTDLNYSVAWSIIIKRYDNKRIIANKHVETLLNMSKMKNYNFKDLSELTNEYFKQVRSLESLGKNITESEFILIPLLMNKLHPRLVKSYEETLTEGELPSLEHIEKYLIKQITILNTAVDQNSKTNPTYNSYVSSYKSTNSKTHSNTKDNNYNKPNYKDSSYKASYNYQATLNKTCSGGGAPTNNSKDTNLTSQSKMYPCYVCHQPHRLYLCPTFLAMTPIKRFELVKSKKLCINCFSNSHHTAACSNRFKCKSCQENHHTLLHREKNAESVSVTMHSSSRSKILLATALVNVVGLNGTTITARALLDSGAEGNFISESLVQKLRLHKVKCNTPVYGLGESRASISYHVKSTVKSRITKFEESSFFYVIKKITSNLPQTSFSIESWHIPPHLKLADPSFNVSQPIELLLGAEYFLQVLTQGKIILSESLPVLQNTQFGWIFSGKYNNFSTSIYTNLNQVDVSRNFLINTLEDSNSNNLDQMLTKFWDLERCQESKPKISNQDKVTEKFYHDTTERLDTGSYQVRLPFIQNPSALGESYETALKCLYSLEKKFSKNPELFKSYSEFMSEYESLNHMQAIPTEELESIFNQPHYFLPHHAVVRESSLTTKLRVVFNASMPTSSGLSLNDTLAVGPQLLNDSFEILVRFRGYRFALIGDVAKMYRQIKVHNSDTNFQLILWRNHPNEPIKIYRLSTVTYGTAPAPYLAIRTMKQLASDELSNHPTACKVILEDFYMDDLLSGANSIPELIHLKEDLISVFQTADMELRKCCSNYPNLEFSSKEDLVSLSVDDTIKTLGMYWQPREDIFKFQVEFPIRDKLTKRVVVSDVCRIFDPLGLLGPAVMKAKLFIRSLWLQHIDWDDELSPSLKNEWQEFSSNVHLINKLSIPRYVSSNSDPIKYELHGFCDASELGYGACIYLKSIYEDSSSLHLLCSKSRVAPTKVQSIPRLELCGALLLSELVSKVKKSLTNVKISNCFLWTDAMIVIHWISSDSCRWKTFISNRVSKIQDLTEGYTWLHIASEENPADLLSRGIINHSNKWWFGPSFLSTIHNYPLPILLNNESIPEERNSIVVNATTCQSPLQFLNPSKWSSWTKFINTVAFVQRFIHNCKNKADSRNLSEVPSVEEIATARETVLRLAQREMFPEEIRILQGNLLLPKSNRLISLCPFIDSQELLRVGGRLKNASLSYNQKHPILLSPDHSITSLIVTYFHKISLHSGPQGLLYAIRQSYWPINGKNICKKVVKNCVTCFKVKPEAAKYFMGELPCSRVSINKPFTHTGLDFAGPILIKQSLNRRSPLIKAYICIMVCFSTKAIHLEPVSDLRTESFLAAFKRFVSRRGYCKHVHCDNGSNFIGARSALTRIMNKNIELSLKDSYSHVGIQFHFNPSKSPSMGGLWESNVKQMKYHLRRIMGLHKFTFEELSTALAQIEAQLNSRPLTPMSDDPNDLSSLCPAHFLVGESLTAVPHDPTISEKCETLLSRWQRVQLAQHQFWFRWKHDYLNGLQTRSKWRHPGKPIQIGTLVLLMEDNLPPLKWDLGRVTELHPGKDNVTRVATVKTSNSVTRRAINKLCPLPI